MSKITWKNLPKPQGFFTKRNTVMLTLDTKKAIQFYSANTKIQVTQYTLFNNAVFFRTRPAEEKNLNWAINADSFDLPENYVASLVPHKSPAEKTSPMSSANKPRNKNVSKKEVPSESEETAQTQKDNLIKRFFKRFKKGKK